MSFNPLCDDKGPPFWQQVVLVAVPALIGGLLPPVIMHFLDKGKEQHATSPKEEQKGEKPATEEKKA